MEAADLDKLNHIVQVFGQRQFRIRDIQTDGVIFGTIIGKRPATGTLMPALVSITVNFTTELDDILFGVAEILDRENHTAVGLVS